MANGMRRTIHSNQKQHGVAREKTEIRAALVPFLTAKEDVDIVKDAAAFLKREEEVYESIHGAGSARKREIARRELIDGDAKLFKEL